MRAPINSNFMGTNVKEGSDSVLNKAEPKDGRKLLKK
jgi:hypothetical protein